MFNITCGLAVSLGVCYIQCSYVRCHIRVAFIIHVFADAFHVFKFGVSHDTVVIDPEIAPHDNANVFNYI